ncbi:dienelactone hydrolase family protein [Candidatus Poriferisodalis sp.]|uniref:dienelactone hydrolase family protein n=1 Tax=Candidatus Poriferisodalis sp. TaxID=3101277 RepID=UPI003AF68169
MTESMSAAGVRWEMHVYGGVRHSYTNESIADRPSAALAYDERAARHTWNAMLAFLDRVTDRSASCHGDRSVDR